MPEARVLRTIEAVRREDWNGLFADQLLSRAEGFDYLLAVEQAGLDGFEWRYVVVEEAGRLLAGAPMFLTTYALDTTLPAFGRRLVAGARKLFSNLMSLRLACLGSPCTEVLTLGFAAEVTEAEQADLFDLLLAAFEAEAAASGAKLMGLKDAGEAQKPLCEALARTRGYRGIAGMPVAHLDIGFDSRDAYLAGLSSGTRKDMRRKLRNEPKLKLEWRHDLDGVMDRTMALYQQTLERADMALESLTPDYFSGVSERMGQEVVFCLYWSEGNLLAVNMLLQGDDVLIDKFFMMEAERGRPLDLYFLSWFVNIDYCLRHGLGRYHSGAAAYEVKLRLGSVLQSTTLYFRHRNPLVHAVLNLAAPLFDADPTRRLTA